jgi:hypothetical protein
LFAAQSFVVAFTNVHGDHFAHVRNRTYIQPVSASKRTADRSAKAMEWLVYRLGGPKATLLGHVTAPNRETALAIAYDELGITTPAERKRIIVQRTSRALGRKLHGVASSNRAAVAIATSTQIKLQIVSLWRHSTRRRTLARRRSGRIMPTHGKEGPTLPGRPSSSRR